MCGEEWQQRVIGGIAPGHAIKTQGSDVYPTLQTLDGLVRHTPLCGDSTGRETAAQPVKDCQMFQAGQWLGVGGSLVVKLTSSGPIDSIRSIAREILIEVLEEA